MANKDHAYIVSTNGSKLSQLTSGTHAVGALGAGKIKFIKHGASTIKSVSEVDGGGVTGIVIPLHGATIGSIENNVTLAHEPKNIIGDPTVSQYALTSGDLFTEAGVEKDGGAQKFVNAVLDGAYRAYTSGVAQASGLNSMTVTRGDLSLASTAVNDGTGIVNTYTRSYTVNFKYYQSGTINVSGELTPANPDIANDNSGGVPF